MQPTCKSRASIAAWSKTQRCGAEMGRTRPERANWHESRVIKICANPAGKAVSLEMAATARTSTARDVLAAGSRGPPGGDAMLEIDPVARRHSEQIGGPPDHVVLELADLTVGIHQLPHHFDNEEPAGLIHRAYDDAGELIEIYRLALHQSRRGDQLVRRAGIKSEAAFDKAMKLAFFRGRRLTIDRSHMYQQRGRRQPISGIVKNPLLMPARRNYIGNELAKSVQHQFHQAGVRAIGRKCGGNTLPFGNSGNLVHNHFVGNSAQRGLFLNRCDRLFVQNCSYGGRVDYRTGNVDRLRGRQALDPGRYVDGLPEIILALVEHDREARAFMNADFDHQIVSAALGIERIHRGAHPQARDDGMFGP